MTRIVLSLVLFAAAAPALADDLFQGGSWASLASDRKASQVGDLITIQVMANNSASNTISQGGRKKTALSGSASASKDNTAGNGWDRSAGLDLGGQYDGVGTNARANRMAAQLGATVTEVLPNGDLIVSGWQALNISGERTNIKVTGRVRREDITADNAVLSSRLADAKIEYDGKGFASRSAKPGIVTQVFNFLGLM